jgi:hypothetical protein
MILLLWFIRRETSYEIRDGVFTKLALVTTVAAQINLVMLLSEIFYKFYSPTHHGINAKYLFFGLGRNNALVPWIWVAVALNVVRHGGTDHPPGQAQPALAHGGVRRPLHRDLGGEGDRPDHPRLRPIAARRDRRVHADVGRAHGDRGHLGSRPVRAHDAGEGGPAHRVGHRAQPAHVAIAGPR